MNCMNRITIPGGLSFIAVAGCLLYAIFAIAAVTDSDCEDAWDDAPAEQYCPATGVSAKANSSKCIIPATQCSITISITEPNADPEDVTFTPTTPSRWSATGSGLNEDSVDKIDICFDRVSASANQSTLGWRAYLQAGCPAASRTSADAKQNGLVYETS